MKQRRRALRDVRLLKLRSRHIAVFSFNLNMFSNDESLKNFRFHIKDIPRIVDAMNVSMERTRRNGYRCGSVTASCIVLSRSASPCRWSDVECMFGRSSALSEVFWEALECFITSRGHLITQLQHSFLTQRCELYANCILEAGLPLNSCIGFLDCTKIQMARPGGDGRLQRSCYSGHKRMHCLIYQTITTPDGLIFHMYGPEVGIRHDLTLLRQSNIEPQLQTLLISGRQFYLYADAAYMLRPWLQVACDRVRATPLQALYNKRNSAVRVSVEWNYKDLKQMWSRNDFS